MTTNWNAADSTARTGYCKVVDNTTTNNTEKNEKAKTLQEAVIDWNKIKNEILADNKREITYLPAIIEMDKMTEEEKAKVEKIIKGMLEKLNKKPVSQEEKEKAYKELENKESSMGIKYKDAVATMKEIKEKYTKNHPFAKFLTSFNLWDKNNNILKLFNPEKLEEPDKSRYYQAMAACIEIEEANKDLATTAGCDTKYPDEKPNLGDLANNQKVPTTKNNDPEHIEKKPPYSPKDNDPELIEKIPYYPKDNDPKNPSIIEIKPGFRINPGFAKTFPNGGENIDPGFTYKPNLEGLSPELINAKPV